MQSTLDTPAIKLYLRLACDAATSAAALHALFMRHKDQRSAEANAIWDGYWALKMDAERNTQALQGAGGLLFFGRAAAIAAARASKEQQA